jgi:hypothetical protein
MKKTGFILTLLGVLALTLSVFTGCVTSKKKDKVAKTEVTKVVEHELSYEVANVDSTQTSLKTVTTVKHFDDELSGSVHLVPFEKDSIESDGLKIVTQLIPQKNGGYKVKIQGKAKAVSKTETISELDNSSSSIASTNIKDTKTDVENTKKTKGKSVKKKCYPDGLCGSSLSSSSVCWLIQDINGIQNLSLLKNDKSRTIEQSKSLALRWNIDSSNRVAKNIRFTNKQFTSRQAFWSRHRSSFKAGYHELRGANSMCSTYPITRRLQGGNRQDYDKLIQSQLSQTTLFTTNGLSSGDNEYARKESGSGYRHGEREGNPRECKVAQTTSSQARIKNTCGVEKVHRERANVYSLGCCTNVLCRRDAMA